MKRVIRLTEQDLARIVKRVIKEQQSSDLIGKTVNFYKTESERQEDFWFQSKIKSIEPHQGMEVAIEMYDEGYGTIDMWFKCTSTKPGFNWDNNGVLDNKIYNKQLEAIIKKTYCTTMRDYNNNEKTVPNADFASTNRSSGNSSVA